MASLLDCKQYAKFELHRKILEKKSAIIWHEESCLIPVRLRGHSKIGLVSVSRLFGIKIALLYQVESLHSEKEHVYGEEKKGSRAQNSWISLS